MTSPDVLDRPADVLFADSKEIIANALRCYLPAERVSVSQYAAHHRYLNNKGGGVVGLWDNSIAPYLVAPMDALTGPQKTTAIVGPARSGKTTIGQNWLLQAVETDPADYLIYAATDNFIDSYVKAEIEPMIELHQGMKSRLGVKPKDRSLSFKRFHGMHAEFISATYNNLIGKSAARIIMMELDACHPDGGRSAYELASIRRQTYGSESMVLAESHPDRAGGARPKYWNDGIMKLYRDSDRHTWWWPCPHCNSFSSPTPGAARETTLHIPEDTPIEEVAYQARLLCPSCGALIEDKDRIHMNQDGFWAAAGQTVHEDGRVEGTPICKDIAGFWITGLMIPLELRSTGIGGLAYDLALARRDLEQTGDDSSLREVMCKGFGVPYTPPRSIRSVDAEALALREDPALTLGRVPEGVRFLTAAADVQANRFEVLIRGWGIDGESWIIDYQQYPADTATNQHAWDEMITTIMTHPYQLADHSGRVCHVLAFGYDSGGQEGVTAQAYSAWRRARTQKHAKYLGKIEGRDVYTVLPLKGMASFSAPQLAVRFPDSQRATSLKVKGNDVPLGQFNPNLFKDRLSSDLLITTPGPRCIHFPHGLGDQHAFYDQLSSEDRLPSGRWEKKRGSSRNEAWDLMVMTDAMAHLFGLHRLDWNSPPAWAAPWDDNIMVTTPTTNAPAPSHTTHVTASAPPTARTTLMERLKQQAAKHGSLPQRRPF